MTTPSLKPCPLCGPAGKLEWFEMLELGTLLGSVRCHGCRLALPLGPWEETAKRWNERYVDHTDAPVFRLATTCNLLAFIGGDRDVKVSVAYHPEGHAGPGLYAWLDAYPGEGAVFLGKQP